MAEGQRVLALRQVQCEGFLGSVCLREKPGWETFSWGQLRITSAPLLEAQQQMQTLERTAASSDTLRHNFLIHLKTCVQRRGLCRFTEVQKPEARLHD